MSARNFRRNRERSLRRSRRRAALRTRRATVTAGVAAGAFALAPAAAHAAQFQVNSLADAAADGCGTTPPDCTLRDALADAATAGGPDEVTFASGLSGTITLTAGALTSSDTSALTISGPGAGVITVTADTDDNGTGESAVMVLNGTGTPKIVSGLTLTEGNSGGVPGGALYMGGGGSAQLNGMVVSDSETANQNGGGVFSNTPTTINNSTVSGNATGAGQGGGVAHSASMTINNSTISGNGTTGNGGGVAAVGKYSPLTLNGSVVTGNSATQGGGVWASTGGPKYDPANDHAILQTTIAGNHASGIGAGIAVGNLPTDSEFEVERSTVSGNDATSGTLAGGGVGFTMPLYGTFELSDSTVSGNEADKGGGISLGQHGQPVASGGGAVVLGNSTIARNEATTAGGGIYLGAYGASSSTIPLSSTIVADNLLGSAPQDLDRADTSTTGGFNLGFSLVETPGDAPLTQTPAGASLVGVDPKLGPLADNSGPTQTHLPADDAPVVDKGQSAADLTLDQRGLPRRVNIPDVPDAADGTDIGSVELQAGPAVRFDKAPKKKIRSRQKKVKVTFAFSADQFGATFECSVDGAPFKACTSPLKLKLKSAPRKGKTHTVAVRAKSAGGEVNHEPTTATVRVIRKTKKKG